MKTMKKIKGIIIMMLLSVTVPIHLTSCGSLSNMSDDDAFDVGRGAGILLRNIIDN